jgi:probable HAF family extracellular repeat protein
MTSLARSDRLRLNLAPIVLGGGLTGALHGGAARGLATLLLCIMMLAPPARSQSSQPKYKVTTLNVPSPARAINDRGQIVGGWNDPRRGGSAYMWTNGIVTNLITMPGGYTGSSAAAINSSGQIAGKAYHSQNGSVGDQAFLYTGGTMISLGCVGQACDASTLSYANGMNESGQIVGYVEREAKSFLYTGGVMTALNLNGCNPFSQPNCAWTYAEAINNQGQVVGQLISASPGTDAQAFLYTPGTGSPTLLAGVDAVAINNKGEAVGYSATSSFLYNGSYVPLAPLQNDNDNYPVAINDSSQVVGGSNVNGGGDFGSYNGRPFLYSNGTMYDLNTVAGLPPAVPGGYSEAVGINTAGQIIVNSYDPYL